MNWIYAFNSWEKLYKFWHYFRANTLWGKAFVVQTVNKRLTKTVLYNGLFHISGKKSWTCLKTSRQTNNLSFSQKKIAFFNTARRPCVNHTRDKLKRIIIYGSLPLLRGCVCVCRSRTQGQVPVFEGDFHMEFCDSARQLLEAYFRGFEIERAEKPWRAFSASWTKGACAQNLGLNSTFVADEYSYILVGGRNEKIFRRSKILYFSE